jgi:hypothetical protein
VRLVVRRLVVDFLEVLGSMLEIGLESLSAKEKSDDSDGRDGTCGT